MDLYCSLSRKSRARPLIPTAAVIIFCCFQNFLTPPCFASPPDALKIDRIQQQITRHKEKIKESKEQELSIHQELEEIDNDLQEGQQKLTFLQERLLRQEKHIQQKEDEITRIQAAKNKIAGHVENRLKSFYQMDEISIVNTLFSASTLPDMLNYKEYFQAMFHYDQQVLQTFSTQITLLAGARNAIQREKEKLLEVILETKKQEEALIATRQKRKDLLNRVQTEEELYRHALAETKIAADKLAKKINSLQHKVIHSSKRKIVRFKSKKKKRPEAISGFPSMQGKLPPPVSGKVVTYFGNHIDKFDTEIFSAGINIQTADKAQVKAIYPGKIVFSEPMTGFGNMIIIDHGQQYHSLVSGLDTINVKTGESVETGQTIGVMGKNTPLLSSGLHVEIRYESHPVDPLLWLDQKTLTITEEQYKYH